MANPTFVHMQVQKRDIWSASGLQGRLRWRSAAQFGFRWARSCMRCSQVGKGGEHGGTQRFAAGAEPRRAALSHGGARLRVLPRFLGGSALELRGALRAAGSDEPELRRGPKTAEQSRAERAEHTGLCRAAPLRCPPGCGRSAPRSRRALRARRDGTGTGGWTSRRLARRPGICWRRCWSPAPTAESRHRRLCGRGRDSGEREAVSGLLSFRGFGGQSFGLYGEGSFLIKTQDTVMVSFGPMPWWQSRKGVILKPRIIPRIV